MMDFLYSIDLSVFYFFNHTLSSGFLDRFFSIITNVNNWYIAYVILLGISFFKGGKKGKIAAVGVIILILFTDQTSAKLIKELFERLRPCNALTDVITPLGCTGSFSFPSNHALNNFAAAAFYYRLFPKLKWILFITASLIMCRISSLLYPEFIWDFIIPRIFSAEPFWDLFSDIYLRKPQSD